jgi:hypothetical protein
MQQDQEQERNNRERAQQAALRRAHSDGALDGLIAFIESQVSRHELPTEPTGAEWPYKRAFQDGQLSGAVTIHRWLAARLKKSPDGAENTEG